MRYPHKPPHASDGTEFGNLCKHLYKKFLGIDLVLFDDEHRQVFVGDAAGWIEFKELKNSKDRFHIEIAENRDLKNWFRSGIYAPNRKIYVCGSHTDVWVFEVRRLIQWHADRKPREVRYGRDIHTERYRLGDPGDPDLAATIHSFVLTKQDALTIYVRRFNKTGDEWSCTEAHAPTGRQTILNHYCHCGEWGVFGYGVSVLRDTTGSWFCRVHRPNYPQMELADN